MIAPLLLRMPCSASALLILLFVASVSNLVKGGGVDPNIECEFDDKTGMFRINWEASVSPKLTHKEGDAGQDYVMELVLDDKHVMKGMVIRGKCKFEIDFDNWRCLIETDSKRVRMKMIPVDDLRK
ncbi:MAG: hypothetical protein EOP84_02100 [Verrucomicrobiaceae bacterium]|nr:MAG: hypothetical protein EOP84_02100 [Verrucomicrobiaceae bacterium]